MMNNDYSMIACEICGNGASINEDEDTLDMNICQACNKLACPKCLEYRSDVKKWLCTNCYEKQRPKKYRTLDKLITKNDGK